jgi:hypothetical protein
MLTYNQHQFRTFFCVGCGHTLTVPMSCHDRFCSVCGFGARIRARDKMEAIVRASRGPNAGSLRFITLTVKNRPDLRDGISFLLDCFKRFRKSAFWKNYVRGGLYVLEVSGTRKDWHMHLHILVEGEFIPQRLLSSQWATVSGAPIVWIEQVKGLRDTVGYLTKYLSKRSVPDDCADELAAVLHSQRLFQTFGTWHNLVKVIPKMRCKCPKCGGVRWIHDRALDGLMSRCVPDS